MKKNCLEGDGIKFTPEALALQKANRARANKARKTQKRAPQALKGIELPSQAAEDSKPEKDQSYWSDVTSRLLESCEVLLLAFVEWELYNPKFTQADWEWDAGHRQARMDIDELYLFFKVTCRKGAAEIDRLQTLAGKANRKAHGDDPFEAIPGSTDMLMKPSVPEASKLYRQANKLEQKLNRDTTAALVKLMKVRGYLWT